MLFSFLLVFCFVLFFTFCPAQPFITPQSPSARHKQILLATVLGASGPARAAEALDLAEQTAPALSLLLGDSHPLSLAAQVRLGCCRCCFLFLLLLFTVHHYTASALARVPRTFKERCLHSQRHAKLPSYQRRLITLPHPSPTRIMFRLSMYWALLLGRPEKYL